LLTKRSGSRQLEENVSQAHAGPPDFDEASATRREDFRQANLSRIDISDVDHEHARFFFAHSMNPRRGGKFGEESVRGWPNDKPESGSSHRQQFHEGSLVDKLTLRQNANVITNPLDVRQVMTGNDDRHRPGEAGQKIQDFPLTRGIKGRGWLIRNEELRLAN
jgi:hypothetical protein